MLAVYKVITATAPHITQKNLPRSTNIVRTALTTARAANTIEPNKTPKINDFRAGEPWWDAAEEIPMYPPMKGEAGTATKWTKGINKHTTMIPKAMSTPFIMFLSSYH